MQKKERKKERRKKKRKKELMKINEKLCKRKKERFCFI